MRENWNELKLVFSLKYYEEDGWVSMPAPH